MIKTLLIEDKDIWEKFVLAYPQPSFLQSWNWGQMQENLGKKIFRFGFFQARKLEGACLLIKQEAKRGNYLEIPGGPLLDWTKPVYLDSFVNLIKQIGFAQHCVFVRLRSQLRETLANRLLLKNLGFVAAPMHLHAEDTLLLDLAKTEEGLLRQMRKNTRYLVKKALKIKDLKVVQSSNAKDIDSLYQLQLETVQRSHFTPFSKNYFLQEFKAFLKDDQIRLFKAVYQKQILAIALIVFYGSQAIYHYSGSSTGLRKIPASYLLQWEAIREAKKRKLKFYNFWGIAPSNQSKHRFAGVSLFKRGFGGEEFSYLHAHDLPLKSKYWLIYLFETLRRVKRGL